MSFSNPDGLKHTALLVDYFKSKKDITSSKNIEEVRTKVQWYNSLNETISIGESEKFKKPAYCCFFKGNKIFCTYHGCNGFKNKFEWNNGTFNKHRKDHDKKRAPHFTVYNLIGFRMAGNQVQIMDFDQITAWCAEEKKQQLSRVASNLWLEAVFPDWSGNIPEGAGEPNFQSCTNAADFKAKFQGTEQTNDWKKCFIVQDSTHLGIECPSSNTILGMLAIYGGDTEHTYIDVHAGTLLLTTQKNFVDMFQTPMEERTTVINNLSMELSNIAEFKHAIKVPEFAEQRSMIKNLKLKKWRGYERYIIMSQAGAFTDFHQDLGGTSVWFHMLKGKKTFYLVEPTEENIRKCEEYQADARTNWYGQQQGLNIRKVSLVAGQTFFMPGSWIHAVYTDEDAVAVAGNFFDESCISRQLRTYRTEETLRVHPKNRVAEFLPVHFAYMTQKLLKVVKDKNDQKINMTKNPVLKSTWKRFQELFAFLDEFKKTRGPVTETTLAPSKVEYNRQIRIQLSRRRNN